MTARPVGGDTREAELREEIAEQLMRDYESEYTVTEPVSAWYPQAARILALPAVRAAQETVRRVEELTRWYEREFSWRDDTIRGVAGAYRRALGGENQELRATQADDRNPKVCPRCGNWCVYDGWDHTHASGIGIGSCAEEA